MIESFKKCFSTNLNDYDYIGINLQINKVLLPIFIIFGLLMVSLAIYRDGIRTFLVQLMRHEALSPEKACTLEEIGLSKSKMIPYLISSNNMLGKIVKRTEAANYSYEEYKALSRKERKNAEKIDFSTEKFFISAEYIDRARHIKEKYEMNKIKLLVGCIFLFLLYVAIAAAMPEVLNMINNALRGQI